VLTLFTLVNILGIMKPNKTNKTTGHDEDFVVLDNNTVIGLMRLRQTTLTEWSRKNGLARPFVCLAMTGRRRGPKARMIVRMLREELGL
jgi:hypothetical protein